MKKELSRQECRNILNQRAWGKIEAIELTQKIRTNQAQRPPLTKYDGKVSRPYYAYDVNRYKD